MFSPCGPSGALCVDDPGYLTTQDSAGQCDSSNLFNYLDSISELPEGMYFAIFFHCSFHYLNLYE